MKKMAIALSLLTFAVAANAERDDSREIQDLMYLPEAKTFYGVSKATIDKGTGELGDDVELDSNTYMLTQEIGYSFSDRFVLNAELSYEMSKVEGALDNTNVITESTTNGFRNPILAAKWRAIDQKESDINVDVLPFLSLKTGNPEFAGSDGDGNALKGTSFGMEAQIGKKYSQDEFLFLIKLIHTEGYESKDKTAFETKSFPPHDSYQLGAKYQRSVKENLFFNVSLIYSTADAYRTDDGDNVDYTKYGKVNTYDLGVESIITPFKNLALAVKLDLSKTSDYSNKNGAGADADYQNLLNRTITLWTRYQF